MKFIQNKTSLLKKIIITLIIAMPIILVSILLTSKAKYQVTQDMKLVEGVVNFNLADTSIIAMYQETGMGTNEYQTIDEVPVYGASLNTEKSYCEYNGQKDENITITYLKGKIGLSDITKKGTKCYFYFNTTPEGQILLNKTIIERTTFTENITEDTTGKIYKSEDDDGVSYYFAGNPTDNYFKFAGFYWRIIRINGNGSIRLIYAGTTPHENKEETDDSHIGISAFNNYMYDNAFQGYMYGTLDEWVESSSNSNRIYRGGNSGTTYKYGSSYTFDKVTGKFTITGTITEETWPSYSRGYSCVYSNNTTCSEIAYVTGTGVNNYASGTSYEAIGAGKVTYEQTHANIHNSAIKIYVDNWYNNNLKSYASYLDLNAGFCNDRSVGNNQGNGVGKILTFYNSYDRLTQKKSPTLKCSNSEDLFTTQNSQRGNKKLTYPIGLITADEAFMAQGGYLTTGKEIWTMTPGTNLSDGEGTVSHINKVGALSHEFLTKQSTIRPVINLKSDIKLTGKGTMSEPYEVVAN